MNLHGQINTTSTLLLLNCFTEHTMWVGDASCKSFRRSSCSHVLDEIPSSSHITISIVSNLLQSHFYLFINNKMYYGLRQSIVRSSEAAVESTQSMRSINITTTLPGRQTTAKPTTVSQN
jgi:hypothetical protein